MIRKLFLNIYIPAIGKTQLFLVPSAMQTRKAISLICKLLEDEYPGVYVRDDRIVLWSEELGGVLNQEQSMEAQNIHDGMKFILF